MPLGGGQEIGANCYLVGMGGLDVLLDCGMHPKKDGLDALPNFSLLNKPPDAVIISHAHLDHCGALPYLLKQFPTVIPYATKPTLSIMDRMLHNSVSVMETIARERGVEGYPLYAHSDVDFALRKAYGIDFDTEFGLHAKSPLRTRFHHAGHVLGSAAIEMYTPDHRMYYTGDICAYDQQLMGKYVPPNGADVIDTLIIESTQGANEDGDDFSYGDEKRRLGNAIRDVIEQGGCALIAAFALGRTQEILNIIVQLQERGLVPDVPVYASGLGRAVYELYDRFSDHLRDGENLAPLSLFGRIGNVWESDVMERLLSEPAILVATSGMMIENTPSAVLAETMVQERRHGIFFVGYCDPDSLGYKLQHTEKGDELVFRLGKSPSPVVLENIQNFRFSAHATRSDLQAIVDHIDAPNVIFVHGDPEALQWMEHHCGDGARKFTPELGRTIHIKT